MQPERPDPTLLDYVEVIARRRATIFTSVIAAIAAATLLAFIVPKTYTSRASILPDPSGGSASSIPFSGMLATLGNLAPGGYSLPRLEPGSQVMGLLESRTLLDRVVMSTGIFQAAYTAQGDTLAALERVHRAWSRRIRLDQDDDTGVIAIEVDAPDRNLAARVANAVVDELNRLNTELAYSTASATRAFTESRLAETRNALRDAQRALVEFQDRYGAVALDEQAVETVRELAKLEGEIIGLQAAREAASVNYTASLGTVRQIDAQIDVLETQKRRILGERPADAAPGVAAPSDGIAPGDDESPGRDGSVLLPLSRVPELSARYANLLLDVRIQESVLTVLHQRIEQSKIEQARDVPVIQVLDRATPPVKHASPRRSLMMVMGTFTGAVVGLVLAAGQEWLSRNEEEARRLRHALRSLTGRRPA